MRKRRLILIFILLVFGVAAMLVRPRKVDCVTTDHTYCPESVSAPLEVLKQQPFLFASFQFATIRQKAKQVEPALATLSFQQTPTGVIVAVAQLSPVVLNVQSDGRNYEIRANGLAQSVDKETQPLLLISDSTQWFSPSKDRFLLGDNQLKALVTISEQYRHFTPRVTKITFYSPEKIQLSLEGKNPVLIRADDVEWLDRQLAALQAFFRSSTMSEEYQELDARFSDLVVR